MKNKKTISPVVAVALLLVVTVVAVVSFQSWFSSFQSELNTDVEQRSQSASGGINVEFISSDGVLYVTNAGSSNVSMDTIKVGDSTCSINQNLTPGVNQVDINSCLNSSGSNQVSLVTDSGIVTETVFVDNFIGNAFSGTFLWNQTTKCLGYEHMTLDSNNNIYIACRNKTLDWDRSEKYNSQGNLIWSEQFNNSNTSNEFYPGFVGIYNNELITIGEDYNSSNDEGIYFIKRDLDGNLISFDKNTNSPTNSRYGRWADIDSLGNMIVKTNGEQEIMKFNPSYGIIWNISNTIGTQYIKTDYSNNIYIRDGSGNDFIVKYNSSNGAHLWNYSKTNYDFTNIISFDFDTSNNIYLVGYKNNDIKILKANSNGAHIWNSTYDLGGIEYGLEIELDTNNNIYIGALTDIQGDDDIAILKFDSSGNYITHGIHDLGGNENLKEMELDSKNNIIALGTNGAGDEILIKFD
jgi:hypothetical protein